MEIIMSPFLKTPETIDLNRYLCTAVELKTSYDRCRALRVPFKLRKLQVILPKTDLAIRLRVNSLLFTVFEIVITPNHYANPQNGYIYILCDPELVILKIFAIPEALVTVSDRGIKPGSVFTEESCGTNALALAREYNQLKAVRGKQHYCQLFKDWCCISGPVKDIEGNVLGYLGISMHPQKELGLTAKFLEYLLDLMEKQLYFWKLEKTSIKRKRQI